MEQGNRAKPRIKSNPNPTALKSGLPSSQQRKKEESAGDEHDERPARPGGERCDISPRGGGSHGYHDGEREHRPEAAREAPGDRRWNDDERAHQEHAEESQAESDGEREGEKKIEVEPRHIDR